MAWEEDFNNWRVRELQYFQGVGAEEFDRLFDLMEGNIQNSKQWVKHNGCYWVVILISNKDMKGK